MCRGAAIRWQLSTSSALGRHGCCSSKEVQGGFILLLAHTAPLVSFLRRPSLYKEVRRVIAV